MPAPSKIKQSSNKFLQKLLNKNSINKKQLTINLPNTQMNHTSFSMQNILNQPLDPNLCKRILQQIKSPLLQQSFAMTNDESLSNSYMNAPKRPDIPPAYSTANQYRRPAIKSKFNTFANGQSFYDQSRQQPHNEYGVNTNNQNFLGIVTNVYDNQAINTNRAIDHQVYPQSRIQMQSVVSPLDPNITLKKQQQSDFVFDIWNKFCGNAHNLSHQQHQQISYDQTKSKFQRKKIFNERAQSILQNTKQNRYTNNHVESILLINENDQKSHISMQNDVQQKVVEKTLITALEQLRRNRHFEIAEFVGILTRAIELLKTAQTQRKFLLDNIQMIFQLTSSQSNGFEELFEDRQNYGKFFSRMKCTSISDIIKKISRNKLVQSLNTDFKEFNRQKSKVSNSLKTMLKSFSQIEQIIEEFLQSPDSINKLRTVYSILSEKFTKNTTKNTKQQITNLFKDVRLFSYQNDAYHLEYLWDDFTSKILTQSEFINGFVKTNGQYKDEKSGSHMSGLEVQLSKMGFTKN